MDIDFDDYDSYAPIERRGDPDRQGRRGGCQVSRAVVALAVTACLLVAGGVTTAALWSPSRPAARSMDAGGGLAPLTVAPAHP